MSRSRRRLFTLSASLSQVLLVAGPVWAQQTHQFTPTQFFNTYSFAHPPALHVKPGDRVVTKTIDAAGVDWNGKTVSQSPNPQTGPFYVDGAEPGDTLVVTFNKIETNRVSAWSGSLLSPYATTPTAISTSASTSVMRRSQLNRTTST